MDKPAIIESQQRFAPETLLKDRARRAEILQQLCEQWYRDTELEGEASVQDKNSLKDIFNTNDQDVLDTIQFALKAFRGAKLRKDGKYLAVHSLELYQKARSLGITDKHVFKTVLLHDILEDTDLTDNDILSDLGPEIVPFAVTMTEKRDENLSREDGLIRFIDQLKNAQELSEEGKLAVVKAEIIDRLDDISDLDYLTVGSSQTPADAHIQEKLAQKMAKCKFTIDELTVGLKDPEIERLRGIFLTVYDFQVKKHSVPAELIQQNINRFLATFSKG